MRISRSPVVLCLLVAVASCRGEPPVPELVLGGVPVTPLRGIAEKIDAIDDTLGFHATTDLLSTSSGYLVVDGGNDRLIYLDRDLRPQAVVGRSGSGPGELEAPFAADRNEDRLAVLELTNARISFFELSGTFLDVVALPTGPGDMALESSGSVLVASAPPTEFLTRIAPGVGSAPFARRPSSSPEGSTGMSKDKVAVARDGTVLVLDNAVGHLHAFGTDGKLLRTASLPQPILETLRSRNDASKAAFARQGIHIVGAGLAKAMKTQPGGQVLVLFTAPPHYGLLIDPDTFDARLLTVPEREGPWEPLLNAVSGVLEGDELTVLHTYGVTRYQLSEVP